VFCISFHFFQKKLKYTEQNYNFSFVHGRETCSVPLREGGNPAEGVQDWSAEEEIWGHEGRDKGEVEETTEQEVLYSVLLTKLYSGDQIKHNELGGACGT
jgi:hypothetical protein